MGDLRQDGHASSAQESIELEAQLEHSLQTTWNARVVNYDHTRFPFADWMRDRIREFGYPIEDLTTLHTVVPEQDVYVLSKMLCDATNAPEFRTKVNAFIRQEIVPQGGLIGPIAAQRFLNVRIMLPAKPHGVFPFHTGLLYGHGRASRSLWMPLTDLTADEDSSASMHVIHLDRSRELILEAADAQLSIQQMTERFGAESHPIQAGPGQVCLFGQEIVHGNFVNETGRTRVSIDFRLAEARYGDQLARKIPGGYFELLPESGEQRRRPDFAVDSNGRSNIIYLNNNTPSTRDVPAHLQRCMVYDYCGLHDLAYDFELFELETMDHLPTLFHIIDELVCNVILYSIYSLPRDRAFRQRIYSAVLERDVSLFFVNEDVCLRGQQDIEHVEELLAFAKY